VRGGPAAALTNRHEVRVGRDGSGRVDQVVGLQGGEMQIAAHQVPVVLRKQDQVARAGLDHFATLGQPHAARALGEQVEQHHMLGTGELLLDAGHAVLAAHAPRGREFGVEEDGAFEPNRFQHARQDIHADGAAIAASKATGLGKQVSILRCVASFVAAIDGQQSHEIPRPRLGSGPPLPADRRWRPDPAGFHETDFSGRRDCAYPRRQHKNGDIALQANGRRWGLIRVAGLPQP
jgi:hypothetical protein